MLTLCVLTYYPENLLISLSRLRGYHDYPFKLIIHNDNPDRPISMNYVMGILNRVDVPIFIHNNSQNVGCFNSRMNVIRLMKENPDMRSRWFIFIDDDDVLLRPRLRESYAPVLNQNALVVRRLRDVLSLIKDPDYYPGRSEFMEEERPKAGCVGIPYDTRTYFEFYDRIQNFIPTLYKIYGTKKIMEPDDCILMYMFRIFLEDKLGMTLWEIVEYFKQFYEDSWSYALTYLEDRVGRYEIADNVSDLRYGGNPGGVSYESLYDSISKAFYDYLRRK
jgi:hypothetical protein